MNKKTKKKRVIIKKGDIVSAPMSDGTVRYLQYIGDDFTQLNSRVIRIFEGRFPSDNILKPENIVTLPVDFYVHVYGLAEMVRDEGWKKIGKSEDVGRERDAIFRTDNNLDKVEISKEWSVWIMNKNMEEVGELKKNEHKQADLGSVFPAAWVLTKMETGEFGIEYPRYE